MVPCAQGRVIVETARPAPPHFATCSAYRRPLLSSVLIETAGNLSGAGSTSTAKTDQQSTSSINKGAISKTVILGPQNMAIRPEDLGVTPWFLEEYPAIDTSPGPPDDRSSYTSYLYADKDVVTGRPDLTSTRNSSMDSEVPRALSISMAPRKAYMDLTDAIALLDETCPNQEPSPALTPRTPRTPLTPYPRNKRARSKSSDNSSNYSNERLSDRSFENTRLPEKEKKRPFLKKIGISKTEDRPFFAKIIGKPYLEAIGPSKAIEKPFLDKLGSSKTLDKFIFETPRHKRGAVKPEPEKPLDKNGDAKKILESANIETTKSENPMLTGKKFATERKRSTKGPLLKMYSFETEDLESTIQTKEHRDPLRGASLDDVLDSGPSSLPLDSNEDQAPKPELEERPTSRAELLKCRVTTSEEVIFSTNTSFGSPREPNSWSNSPRRILRLPKDSSMARTPTRRRNVQNSREGLRSDDSTPNSPTKRPISNVSPDRQIVPRSDTSKRSIYSPTKARRQTLEDILDRNGKDEDDRKASKQSQFERRGISSDNILWNNRSLAITEQGNEHLERTRETSSEDSLARRGIQEYSKETFKQLQDKFKFHEIPTETYADFKRRTRGNVLRTISRQRDCMTLNIRTDTQNEKSKNPVMGTDESGKMVISVRTTKSEEGASPEVANEVGRGQGATVRSVLRKQEGIDHPSDHESDTNATLRRPTRRIFHEPSQETMDLLTELRKVKSLLKTPSCENELYLELDKKPARQPKRILLTDKEFCLSVERENSVRRPSRVINSLEKTEEGTSSEMGKEKQGEREKTKNDQREREQDKSEVRIPGPALFEKKCLSLDYADDEKPQKPEPRAISLASTRNLPWEDKGSIDYSDFALIRDSKSYSSDVFNSPTEEINEKQIEASDLEKGSQEKVDRNHCADLDAAVPVDQRANSPKGKAHVQGKTGDHYEIISPRSTPIRMKKRLGKISVEETVKPESFTLGSKVDCRSTVTQKRTKCLPL